MPPQYLIAVVLTRSNFTAVKRADEFAIQPVKWPRVFKVNRRFWWNTGTSKWETTQSQMEHACSKCAHALRRVQPLHFPFHCPYDLMIPFRIKYHSGRSVNLKQLFLLAPLLFELCSTNKDTVTFSLSKVLEKKMRPAHTMRAPYKQIYNKQK